MVGYEPFYDGGGYLSLTETDPPQSFVEPLTLAQVKSFLKLPPRVPANPDEDEELESLIRSARAVAELHQGRDLVRKQWDMTFDSFCGHVILSREPLVSVDLVQYRDSAGALTVVLPADYIVDAAKGRGVLLPGSVGWPSFTAWPSSAILVRYTSGFAADSVFWKDEGEPIKHGMRKLIADSFINKLPFERSYDPAKDTFGVASLLSHGGKRILG